MLGIFDINAKPSNTLNLVLSSLLFVAGLLAYTTVSYMRTQANEGKGDKLVPSIGKMVEGTKRAAFKPDRKGDYRLYVDTIASGKRFLISLFFLSFAVLLGLLMGVFPMINAIFHRFILFFDKIPALALLPILFLVFGLGESSKIALILLGVFPTMALDTCLRAKAIPREQIVKAQTLGASNMEISFQVILPQIMPEVLDTLRLNFKAMILFLIAGESLAATVGLGYRIFLLRRYIAMDIIIPYVIWMSLLALTADWLVRLWVAKRYSWKKTA